MLDTQFTLATATFPNLNVVAFGPSAKPAPVIVAVVPPLTGPLFGLIAEIDGPSYVN